LGPFQCPHCEQEVAVLAYDGDQGMCPNPMCRGKLFVTDFLGFHQEMAADSAPDSSPEPLGLRSVARCPTRGKGQATWSRARQCSSSPHPLAFRPCAVCVCHPLLSGSLPFA
jgi:hypothetical protein